MEKIEILKIELLKNDIKILREQKKITEKMTKPDRKLVAQLIVLVINASLKFHFINLIISINSKYQPHICQAGWTNMILIC